MKRPPTLQHEHRSLHRLARVLASGVVLSIGLAAGTGVGSATPRAAASAEPDRSMGRRPPPADGQGLAKSQPSHQTRCGHI